MKKTLFGAGAGALLAVGLIAPNSAQAAGSPYFPEGTQSISDLGANSGNPGDNNHVQVSDAVFWCSGGYPIWAIAVRNTAGTHPIQVTDGRSYNDGELSYQTQPIGNGWTVISGKKGSIQSDYHGGWSANVYFTAKNPDGSSGSGNAWYGTTPDSGCKGLPTAPPALGQAPGSVVTPPTKPTPTKTTTKPAPTKTSTKPAPVKTTTKPAPVKTTTAPATKPAPSTSKATATGTVKVTTPGGSKTTTVHGTVPVTKPVPSGGVTATASTTIPGKATATATVTVKPIGGGTSSSAQVTSSAVGPKVQTDNTGSNSKLEMELGGAAALALVAAGGVVAARRRD